MPFSRVQTAMFAACLYASGCAAQGGSNGGAVLPISGPPGGIDVTVEKPDASDPGIPDATALQDQSDPAADRPSIVDLHVLGQETKQFPTYLWPLFGKKLPNGKTMHVVDKLVLHNLGAKARTVTVKALLQGFSEEGGPPAPIHLEPNETKELAFDLPFKCDKLDGVSSDQATNYKVALVDENGLELDSRNVAVSVMPKNRVFWLTPGVDWNSKTQKEVEADFHYNQTLVAALFTTKDDNWKAIDGLVAEATKLSNVQLTALTPDTMTPDQQKYVAGQALVAIFKALKGRGVNYSSVGTEFFVDAQTVRYPAESLYVESQNCIDGALVFASALERMGFWPYIQFVPGHAFVRASLTHGGPMASIETTMISDYSAELALLDAEQELADPAKGKSPEAFAVDVRGAHEGGLVPSNFPCSSKPAPPKDPCGGDLQCSCSKSLDCKRSGKCSASEKSCTILGDADCAKSANCKDWGRCKKYETSTDGVFACFALEDGDCQSSNGCKLFGYCKADGKGHCMDSCGDGACQPGESATACPEDCKAGAGQCGDGQCASSESCTTCAADCGKCASKCGNGSCDAGENTASCPADCAAKSCSATDNYCTGNTLTYCETDGTMKPYACPAICDAKGQVYAGCGKSTSGTVLCLCSNCGNGKCDGGETPSSCPGDCSSPSCSSSSQNFCTGNTLSWCNTNTGKFQTSQCTESTCAAKGEVSAGCGVSDSGTVLCLCTTCGNGTCDGDEDPASCPEDCPSHYCDNHCGGAGVGCYCDATCQKQGDCCNWNGKKPAGSTCAGSNCGECN